MVGEYDLSGDFPKTIDFISIFFSLFGEPEVGREILLNLSSGEPALPILLLSSRTSIFDIGTPFVIVEI